MKVFGEDKILVAPIKELRRVKAKLNEYKDAKALPPYAACICDYLRATVLSDTFAGMFDVLERYTCSIANTNIKKPNIFFSTKVG